MQITHQDLKLQFDIGTTTVQVLNLVYERFQRTIPSHSHGSGCFEIHYISAGYGCADINGSRFDLTPGTLYITGPHVEHAQMPSAENPMCEYCIYLKLNMPIHTRDKAHANDAKQSIVESFRKTPFWYGQDLQQVYPVISDVFSSLKAKNLGYEMEVEALLRLLLVRLARLRTAEDSMKEPFSHPPLYPKTPFVIEEYFLYEYASLSLQELAARIGLSTRQTERFLRKLSPSQYRKQNMLPSG